MLARSSIGRGLSCGGGGGGGGVEMVTEGPVLGICTMAGCDMAGNAGPMMAMPVLRSEAGVSGLTGSLAATAEESACRRMRGWLPVDCKLDIEWPSLSDPWPLDLSRGAYIGVAFYMFATRKSQK